MAGGEIGPASELVRIEKMVYGGDGLTRTGAGQVVFLPFVLPGELVDPNRVSGPEQVEASPARIEPRCVHFGVCGGCQYQMADYPEQLRIKAAILRETLARAGVIDLPELRIWGSPEPWGYRNRIRLRARVRDGVVRLGYSVRGTQEFLPVTMCPIAAPVLWAAADSLVALAARDRNSADWVGAAAEVEISCDAEEMQVSVHLLCPRAVPQRKASFDAFARALEASCPPLKTCGASRLHAASGRAGEELASWGAGGLVYPVLGERFWLARGTFFQVNRFLLPQLLELVCAGRTGALAWDLYAGVGLFARKLMRRFAAVTAVEANSVATTELRRALRGSPGRVVEDTTLGFLRSAVVQRERPDLVVLDPPRAGAGPEACELLRTLAPCEIVYVSCDPTTLARDLGVLLGAYRVAEWHMVDLFPQTYHLETVMVLHRSDVPR